MNNEEIFFEWLEKHKDFALGVYDVHYNEKAGEEGFLMQDDPQYYGDDECDREDIDLYEEFSHCVGESAKFHGARGVLMDLGEGHLVDPDDRDLQWEVLLILEKE